MGGKTSVQNKQHCQDSSGPEIASNLRQTKGAIYMTDAVVHRLAKSNDNKERVTVYNIPPRLNNTYEKTLSVSKPPLPVERAVNRTEDNGKSSNSLSPRISALKKPPTRAKSEPDYVAISPDPLRRQINKEIEEDLKLKDKLTTSIRQQIRLEEPANWESYSRLSNARNVLASCYAANPNNPMACTASVKHFTDTVNKYWPLSDSVN